MIKMLLLLATLTQLASDNVATEDVIAKYRRDAVERWEADIKQLEALDAQQADPEHAVLFVGSSSIRLWETMAQDLHPWPTIRRGYGGAKFSDLAVFIERLTSPHDFDALVIFVGNDISNSEQDKSPEEILQLCKFIVSKVRQKHPEQPIFFIGVTPTPVRFAVWEKINRANALIEQYCGAEPRLHFIATAKSYLNADGTPKAALFRDDRLHLNREGYKLWSQLISAELSQVLGSPTPAAGN